VWMRGPSVAELHPPEDAVALDAALGEAMTKPGAALVVELPVRDSSGYLCHAEMTITNLCDNPNVGGLVLNSRDISERKALEDQLVHQAFHDSLTALANRALFRDRVEELLEDEGEHRTRGAILFLDLDGFKEIN